MTDFKVKAPEQILSMMTTKEFQPDRTVFLEENPRWKLEGERMTSPPGRIPLAGRIKQGGRRL